MSEPEKKMPFKFLKPEEIKTFPTLPDLSPEELAQAYAFLREAFTAEDLQRFTEVDGWSPVEDFMQELEEAQRQFEQGAQ